MQCLLVLKLGFKFEETDSCQQTLGMKNGMHGVFFKCKGNTVQIVTPRGRYVTGTETLEKYVKQHRLALWLRG